MKEKLIRRFGIEISHFQGLNQDTRLILLSYAFFLASYPLVLTFIEAYLWRSSQNLWVIIAYSAGQIAGLPMGFYVNGFLLKKINILKLYFIGTVIQGVTAILIVFLSSNSVPDIFLLGTLFGFGAGLYWSNKNFLSLQLTRNSNRIYYNSLEQTVDLLINLLVPALAGWFIAFGGMSDKLYFSGAYKIVMLVGFILLVVSGLIVQSSKVDDVSEVNLFIGKPSNVWKKVRLFNFLYNIGVGLSMAVSSVLVLVLVGGEGILGTLQTVSTLISALAAYMIGRKTKISNSWKLVGIGSLLFLFGSSVLAVTFTWVGGLIYTVLFTLAWTFQWSPAYAVEMEVMDKEDKTPEKQYAFVCDNELFFNIGRVLGLGIVGFVAFYLNDKSALRWTPLIIAIIQFPLAGIINFLSKEISKSSISPQIIEVKRHVDSV